MSEEAQTARLDALQEDISEIKAATRKMAEALERLARLEERQATVSSSIDRLFGSLGKVQERLGRLEAAQPVQRMTSTWVMDSAKFIAGAVAMFLLKKAGVL